MTKARDTEAGQRVATYVHTHPGKITVADVADGANVAPTTASGYLRRMLALDPNLRLIRRGQYEYLGKVPVPAGPPLKTGDMLEITGIADGRYLATDEGDRVWVVVAPKITI